MTDKSKTKSEAKCAICGGAPRAKPYRGKLVCTKAECRYGLDYVLDAARDADIAAGEPAPAPAPAPLVPPRRKPGQAPGPRKLPKAKPSKQPVPTTGFPAYCVGCGNYVRPGNSLRHGYTVCSKKTCKDKVDEAAESKRKFLEDTQRKNAKTSELESAPQDAPAYTFKVLRSDGRPPRPTPNAAKCQFCRSAIRGKPETTDGYTVCRRFVCKDEYKLLLAENEIRRLRELLEDTQRKYAKNAADEALQRAVTPETLRQPSSSSSSTAEGRTGEAAQLPTETEVLLANNKVLAASNERLLASHQYLRAVLTDVRSSYANLFTENKELRTELTDIKAKHAEAVSKLARWDLDNELDKLNTGSISGDAAPSREQSHEPSQEEWSAATKELFEKLVAVNRELDSTKRALEASEACYRKLWKRVCNRSIALLNRSGPAPSREAVVSAGLVAANAAVHGMLDELQTSRASTEEKLNELLLGHGLYGPETAKAINELRAAREIHENKIAILRSIRAGLRNAISTVAPTDAVHSSPGSRTDDPTPHSVHESNKLRKSRHDDMFSDSEYDY